MNLSEDVRSRTWDVIVVGGGSAGCVVAAELSRAGDLSVLLVEAGRDTPPGDEPEGIRDPYYASAMRDENFWPGLQVNWISDRLGVGRTPALYEQARIMGGGSSVNSMIAIRAVPDDFAEWTEAGLSGWSWDDVLPFFKEIEADQDFNGDLHGSSGPIPIRRHAIRDWPLFCKTVAGVLAAGGLPLVEDMNADFRDGYVRIPMNNLPTQRVSAAMGFLDQSVRRRSNLAIVHGVLATRLVLEEGRVVGLEVAENGSTARLRAGSTFLCAGTIHSPALLQRSGIGPADALRPHGIAVAKNLPGVGRNLQEHPTASIGLYLEPRACQHKSLRAHANLGVRMTSPQPWAPKGDIYASIMAKSSWHALGRRIGNFLISLHKPFSRGEVSLRSADPLGEPRVDFNFFDDRRDMDRMVSAVQYFWSVAKAPPLQEISKLRFLAAYSPFVQALNRFGWRNRLFARAATMVLDSGSTVRRQLFDMVLDDGGNPDHLIANERALENWIARNATGFYHPVGTCAMGSAGNGAAVVDSKGKLMGLDGLWIADASVMPTIIRANTNLTTMASALKLARGWRASVR